VNLWLDDVRDPADYGLDGWTWVKTVDEAKSALQLNNVQKLALDHDLGACADCMQVYNGSADLWLEASGYQAMPNCSHFGTGYDLVLWMAEKGIWSKEKPTVHSANPVGAKAMRQTIDRYFPEAEDAVQSED
jgi:hypothetical protein